MLTYLFSAAVAAAIGTAGGFLGGRLSVRALRRDHVSALQGIDRVADGLRRDLAETDAKLRAGLGQCPTRDDLGPFFQAQQQLAAAVVTRDELRPILKEVITREELDMALSAVVTAISKNAGLPLPGSPSAAVPVMAASQDQLATVIADMSRQMAGINQQLGL